MEKLDIYIGLMQLVENGFIHKLKKKNPNLSEQQLRLRVVDWYLDKPMPTPANCIKGDISRFTK